MKSIFIILSCAFIFSFAEQLESPLVLTDPTVENGLTWLSQQHEADYGFKDHTALVITTLQMANTSGWYSGEHSFSQLATKQMDIELLQKVARHHETPLVPEDVAQYSLALSSLCRKPQQFYGIDIIGTLTKHELLLDMEYSISSLAICASGAHVRKRQLRRLLEMTESTETISSDILAMVMLALNCIVHDYRNRNLQHYLIGPSKFLGKMQKPDGSFGSLKHSALALQALEATDPGGQYWNKSAAIAFLKAAQQKDGSFGEEKDVATTAYVLLAMGPRSLSNIKDLNCFPNRQEDWQASLAEMTLAMNMSANEQNVVVKQPLSKAVQDSEAVLNATDNGNEKKEANLLEGVATISYSLWVGTNVTNIYAINVTAEPNSTFYHVMQIAAQKNSNFSFEATEWPNGHYIHTLANCKEEPMTYQYWLLYRLPSEPQVSSPPSNQFVAPVGVDDLFVNDGDYFLFWYKKL